MPIIPVTWIIAAFFVGYFGRHRTMGFWGYFFASLLLTPLIGVLLLIVSAKRKPASGAEDEKA